MDVSKQGVSFLENFPPDIWAYVVSYLPGEQLGRLKMTGAKSLWSKLRVPHVVKSVKLGKDFIQFKSWPAFLGELPSLDELSVDSTTSIWWSKLNMKLHSVPRTVRKLEISSGIASLGKFFLDSGGGVLKFEDYTPHLDSLDLSRSWIPKSSWVTLTLPQTLTKLVALLPAGVELPPSLVYFQTSCFDARKYAGEIPPHLETFIAYELLGLECLVPLLPLSLLRLCTYSASYIASASLFGQFPKSMTCLELPSGYISTLPNYEQIISHLPPKLTKLGINSEVPASTFAFFPSTLATLKCVRTVIIKTSVNPTTGNTYEIRSYPFETLPRSLTHLELSRTFFEDIPFCALPPDPSTLSSYFPPGLAYLSVEEVHLSPETVKLLPTSLTYLELGMLCEKVCQHLPRGLISLKASATLMSPNLIKFLPNSLTSLVLNTEPSTMFDYDTAEEIEDFEKQTHPQYLIHQNYGTDIDWKTFSLPPKVTLLTLDNCAELRDSFVLDNRLSNLVELRLPESKHFSDRSIPFLGRHLAVLILDGAAVTGNCFQHLPRSLTHLRLRNASSIFDPHIEHLPRTLKILDMSSAVHLTESCILSLPPDLEMLLVARNEKITHSCFPNMPYRLRSSQTDNSIMFATWRAKNGELIGFQ